MFELNGKVALVTGSGQGVGAGIAMVLARQGASVAVNDLFEDRTKKTVERIKGEGGKAFGVPFDVTDRNAVTEGVAKIQDSLGPVDILVNNAGVPVGMNTVHRLHWVHRCKKNSGIDLSPALGCTAMP